MKVHLLDPLRKKRTILCGVKKAAQTTLTPSMATCLRCVKRRDAEREKLRRREMGVTR